MTDNLLNFKDIQKFSSVPKFFLPSEQRVFSSKSGCVMRKLLKKAEHAHASYQDFPKLSPSPEYKKRIYKYFVVPSLSFYPALPGAVDNNYSAKATLLPMESKLLAKIVLRHQQKRYTRKEPKCFKFDHVTAPSLKYQPKPLIVSNEMLRYEQDKVSSILSYLTQKGLLLDCLEEVNFFLNEQVRLPLQHIQSKLKKTPSAAIFSDQEKISSLLFKLTQTTLQKTSENKTHLLFELFFSTICKMPSRFRSLSGAVVADSEKVFTILYKQFPQRRAHCLSQMKAILLGKVYFSSMNSQKKLELASKGNNSAILPTNYANPAHTHQNKLYEAGVDIKPVTLPGLFPGQISQRPFFQKAVGLNQPHNDLISFNHSPNNPSKKHQTTNDFQNPTSPYKHIPEPLSSYFLSPKAGSKIFPIHSLKNPLFRGLRPIRMKSDNSQNKSPNRFKKDSSSLNSASFLQPHAIYPIMQNLNTTRFSHKNVLDPIDGQKRSKEDNKSHLQRAKGLQKLLKKALEQRYKKDKRKVFGTASEISWLMMLSPLNNQYVTPIKPISDLASPRNISVKPSSNPAENISHEDYPFSSSAQASSIQNHATPYSLQSIGNYGWNFNTPLNSASSPVDQSQGNEIKIDNHPVPPANPKGFDIPPNPPIDLEAHVKADDRIGISWKPAKDGPPAISYKIYHNLSLTDLAGSVRAGDRLYYEEPANVAGINKTYYIVSVSGTGKVSSPTSIEIM